MFPDRSRRLDSFPHPPFRQGRFTELPAGDWVNRLYLRKSRWNLEGARHSQFSLLAKMFLRGKERA